HVFVTVLVGGVQRPQLRPAAAYAVGAHQEEQDEDHEGNHEDRDKGSCIHLSRHLQIRNANLRTSTRTMRRLGSTNMTTKRNALFEARPTARRVVPKWKSGGPCCGAVCCWGARRLTH